MKIRSIHAIANGSLDLDIITLDGFFVTGLEMPGVLRLKDGSCCDLPPGFLAAGRQWPFVQHHACGFLATVGDNAQHVVELEFVLDLS